MVAATTAVLDDPYQVLNVPHTTATPAEIKQSYRILAKKYHPDTWSASCFTQEEKEHATTIFQKVAAAYELLTDPIQKSIYDRNYKLGMYDHTDKKKKKKNNNTNTTDDCRGTTPHSSNNENSTGRGTASSSSSSNPRQHSQSKESQNSPPRRNTPPIGIPPPLPKGWSTTKDYKSGQLYYYHPKSGRSSWIHPALCSNTSEYNANNNNTTNTNTPNMNTNFNFNGRRQQQGKGNGPKMSGGDFPFNRRTEHSNNEHIFNNDYAAYNENNTHKHQKSNNSYYDPNYDETIYAGGRKIMVDDEPDTHRCGAFMALVLCPPLGIFAAYNSIMVTICLNRASEITTNGLPPLDIDKDDDTTPHNKKKKQEELALAHSNLAGISTCVGNIIGIIFWVCYSLFREDSDFEWPKEWSFEEWFDDK